MNEKYCWENQYEDNFVLDVAAGNSLHNFIWFSPNQSSFCKKSKFTSVINDTASSWDLDFNPQLVAKKI